MIGVAWLLMWVSVATVTMIGYPRRFGAGALSRLTWRLVVRRPFPPPCWSARIDARFVHRQVQQVIWWVGSSIVFGVPAWLYWLGATLPYIDDLLTGEDDDRWKRRWQAVKNRVKWRMALPARVPSPGTA